MLRNRQLGGWKWKRQVPWGRYIVDFYCADAILAACGGEAPHLASPRERGEEPLAPAL